MRFARFPHPSLQTLGAATIRATAPSPHMHYRGRNPWRREFCDHPSSPDGRGGSVGGDSQLRPGREPNHGFRQGHNAPPPQHFLQTPPQQHYRPYPPPPQYRQSPPPLHYGPPPPHFHPPPPHFHPPPPHFGSPPPPPHFGSPPPPQQYFNPPFHHPPPAYVGPPPTFRQPPMAHWQRPLSFRQNTPYKSADHREWNQASSQPPPQCEKFVVISYNILADYLARDHRSKLYFHIPHNVLDWEWRKRRLLIEFGLWNPDIMCLQEVDKFHDLEEELAVRGYTGIWKMRTGHAIDGCAIFWRTNRFQLRYEEHIEYNKLGLRDNVAQICVLESRIQSPVENASASLPASSDQPGANRIVVCNIHVLYNPKRGEIKLGQVRVLLDRAYAVSRIWNDAPVVICGDFNSTPKSPLYNFISEQKLSLSGLARDEVSGQYSANSYAPRTHTTSGLYSSRPSVDKSSEVSNGVEQRTSCTGSHTQSKSLNDMENTSLSGTLPPHQSSTGVLEMSTKSSTGPWTMRNDTVSDATAKMKMGTDIPNVCHSESASIQFTYSDKSMGTTESCNEQRSLLIFENCNELTPVISSSIFEVALQEHQVKSEANEMIHLNQVVSDEQYSLSDPNIYNQSIDKLNLHVLCQKQTEYSNDVEMSTKSENFADFECRNGTIHTNWNSNFEESSETSSSNMGSESVFADTRIDDNLMEDVATEVSSFKIVLGTVPVNLEASIIESGGHSSADLAIEQKDGFDISCNNTHESKYLCTGSSTSLIPNAVDTFVNESDIVDIEDANINVDHGRINSAGDIHPFSHKNVPSLGVNSYNESSEPSTEEGCQVSGLHKFQYEDPVSGDQDESMAQDLSSSEENSDPNFFKELLGTEDSSQYREDIIPFSYSCQIQSSSAHSLSLSSDTIAGKEEMNNETKYSACLHKSDSDPSSVEVQMDSTLPVGPHAANQDAHLYIPYNPYLWTPMEIEVASGNAECISMEHSLKLRSAYTDVEDCAGTKDSSREPQVTSYNRQFMGTVDYIWYSEGVQTVKALNTIPKHILRRTSGFPTQKWGSDHIALACELAFTKGFSNK